MSPFRTPHSLLERMCLRAATSLPSCRRHLPAMPAARASLLAGADLSPIHMSSLAAVRQNCFPQPHSREWEISSAVFLGLRTFQPTPSLEHMLRRGLCHSYQVPELELSTNMRAEMYLAPQRSGARGYVGSGCWYRLFETFEKTSVTWCPTMFSRTNDSTMPSTKRTRHPMPMPMATFAPVPSP